MKKDIVNDINKIKNIIYDKENKIPEEIVQNLLFKIITTCLNEQQYEITIGSYIINLDPKNLNVVYKTNTTNLQKTMNDYTEESIINGEIKYFTPKNNSRSNNELSLNTEVLKVTEFVNRVNDHITDNYNIELFNSNSNIVDFIIKDNNLNYKVNKNQVIVSKRIKKEDLRIKLSEIINLDKLLYVIYTKDKLVVSEFIDRVPSLDYSFFLPDLEYNRYIVNLLFNIVILYYKNYMTNY